MPLLSSTTALAVYTVAGASDVTSGKLAQFAFRSIDDLPEERGWGWVCIEDMFDTEWRTAPPEKGEFMCFSLRVDTRKVASGVLRKHLAEAMATEEAKVQTEGRKVSSSRKKELKEVFMSKLLRQAEPVPAAFDVAVNMSTGLILVSSVSTAQLELFEQHFATSFGVKPERWLLDSAEGQKLLATVYEHGLSPTVDGHTFDLSQAGQATLIQLESGASVTAKDEPETISKALQTGLVFSRLKLHLARQDDESLEWTLILGSDGAITGLKTPKVEKPDGDDGGNASDAVLLEKLYLLGLAVDVIREIAKG